MSFRSVKYYPRGGIIDREGIMIDDTRFRGNGIFLTISDAKKIRNQLDRELKKKK